MQTLEESSVLALVGPWGSGKSSLINLISEEIGEPWQVCHANMWAPPDVAALLADLFATIRTALPDGGPAGRLKTLFTEYAQLAIPALSLVPVVGDAAQSIAVGLAGLHARRPMQPLFDQLSGQLRHLGLRVLVVLDDVDRLQPDELLTLFKAIRLIARFPGVYYLLAYDEQTVIDVLASTPVAQGRPDRALAYLEKIVQVRLDLPPAQRYYTEKMLSDGITALLGRLGMALSDEQASRFRELYDRLLQFTLAQPRAVGRFLRQAVAYLPMTEPGEFDVVDFLALTHLRSQAPATYQVIARSKEALTRQPGYGAGSPATIRELLEERLRAESSDAWEQVMEALTELFPAIDVEYLTRLGAADWQQRAAARRASVAEYFDRYFLFALPVGDIADSTALQALAAIAHGERSPALAEAEARISGGDPGAASRVIAKLTRLSAAGDVTDVGRLGEMMRYALSLPARTTSAGSLLGSAEHQSITWATELLVQAGRSGLQMDSGLAASLEAMAFARLCDALRQAVQTPGQPGYALLDTYDQVAVEACRRVQDHLRERDSADPELPAGLLVQFVNRSSSRAGLVRALAADLDAGTVTLPDLASRFVAVGRFTGGRQEITGFDHEALISLLGLSRLWDLHTAGHHDGIAEPAGDNGTIWHDRRAAGVSMLGDALAKRREVPPRPPSGTRSGTDRNPGQQTAPRQWASRIQPGRPTDTGTLVCIRAAVLLPGTAQGLPNGPASASVFEESRARTLAGILGQVPLTAWCWDTARRHGLEPGPGWEEDGHGNRMYAEFALRVKGADEVQPLEGRCAITTGSQAGDRDVLALALDLLLQFPHTTPAAPAADLPVPVGGRLSMGDLAGITEIVTGSAIKAAAEAAASLLGTRPDDGHLTLWLEASEPFDRVLDLDAFPVVGGQSARAEASVSAALPLEPGQAYGSADFATSLRGITVELLHELLRGSGRRGYTVALHALHDAVGA